MSPSAPVPPPPSRRSALRTWLAFFALTLLVFAPRLVYWHEGLRWLPLRWGRGGGLVALENTAASLLRRSGQDPWFLQVELLAAFSLLWFGRAWWGASRTGARWLGRGLGALWGLLFALELNTVLGHLFMTQEPLFYDELFLLRHLLRLAGDLWQPLWFVYAALGLGALGLVALLVRALVRQLMTGLRGVGRVSLVILGLLWTVVGLDLLWFGVHDPRAAARWASPGVMANLVESAAVYRQVHSQVAASPYRALDAVELTRRPDVHIVIIESYGKVVATMEPLRESWEPQVAGLEERLGAQGWSMASAWCRAPISGGRSWLADASLFMGVRIFHESVYRHLLDQPEPVNVVRWFRRQGYETLIVAPADRARPGIELENLHHFEHTAFQKDMDYEGPPLGWGLVPDQHALGLIRDELVPELRAEGPVFTSLHGTTSHVPWDGIPPVMDHWRELAELPGAFDAAHGEGSPEDEELSDSVRLQLKRYRDRSLKATPGYQGEDGPSLLPAYRDAMTYQLEVLEEHLEDFPEAAAEDTLFVVMGDHQPPWMNKYQDSYDVPMHLFARDPVLLAEFLEQGFEPGLRPSPDRPAVLNHEGFFSLLVRALASCCSTDDIELPEFFADGLESREALPEG